MSLVSPGDWCADVKRGADTGTVSPPLTVALDQAQNRADTSAWLMSTKLWPEEVGARGKPRKLARGPWFGDLFLRAYFVDLKISQDLYTNLGTTPASEVKGHQLAFHKFSSIVPLGYTPFWH